MADFDYQSFLTQQAPPVTTQAPVAPAPAPALSYRDALTDWERSKAFGDTRSLPDYATQQDALFGGDSYKNAVAHDGPWSKLSTRLDIGLEGTVGSPIGAVTGAVGNLFGHEEGATEFGQKLPRMLMDMAPLALGGVPGALATGAAFGGHTYADTGSPKAGLISGAAGALLPTAGRLGGELGVAAARSSGLTGDTFLSAFGRKAAQFTGSQVAQAATNMASNYGVQKTLAPGQDYNPLADEHFWLQQLPFTVIDAIHAVAAPRIPGVAPAKIPASVVKQAPEYTPPTAAVEDQTKVESVIQKLNTVANDPNVPPEQKGAVLAAAIQQVLNPDEAAKVRQNVQAQTEAKPDTYQLTGRAEPVGNGNYRVLVDSHNVPGASGDLVGSTVFVNGVEPTEGPGPGQHTFNIPSTLDNVTRAKFPLPTDFKVTDPNQPELVPRAEGVEPTPMLNSADVAGLKDMGVEPPTTPEVVPELKPIIADHEQASIQASEALKKATVPITDATEIPPLVGPEPKEPLQKATDVGATAPQAVEAARLQTQTGDLDAATKQMEVLKARARVLTGAAQNEARQVGNLVLTAHEAKARIDPASPSAEIVAAVQKVLQDQQIKDPKFVDRIYTTLAKNLDQPADVVIRKLNATASNAKKTPSVNIESYLVDGARVKSTKAEELQKYIVEHGLDQQGFGVESRTRENKEKGRWTEYYVGKRQFPVGETGISLDKETEGGATLADTIGDDTSAITQDVPDELAPEVKDDFVGTLDELIQDPQGFAEHIEEGSVDPETVQDVREELQYAKDKITSLKRGEVLKDQRARDMLRAVHGYNVKYQNFSLDSFVPHDEAVVQEMKIRDGIVPALQWFINHKDSGIAGVLLKSMLRAMPDLQNVEFALPGTQMWDSRGGWYYKPGLSLTPTVDNVAVRPRINVPKLPSDTTDALQWSYNLAHEVAHHASTGLTTRPDAAAEKFREVLDQVRDALSNSKALPAKVRATIRRAQQDGDLIDYRNGDLSASDMMQKWEKSAGKGFGHLIYGLQSRDELLSSLFNSPELVGLSANTKLPGMLQNALQYFSAAWNRIFMGTSATDSALSQILQKFDNFLSAGQLRDGYTARDYMRKTLLSRGVRPEALASRMDSIEQVFNTGSLDPSIKGFQREGEAGILPTSANDGPVSQNMRISLLLGGSADVYKSTLGLLMDELPQHQDLWYRMMEDTAVAKELMTRIKSGQLPGTLPNNAEKNLELSTAKVNSMKDGLYKQQTDLARLNGLSGLTPEGWGSMMAAQLTGDNNPAPPPDVPARDEVARAVGLEHLAGKSTINPILRFFGFTQHIKEIYPATKPAINRVFNEQGDAYYRRLQLDGTRLWNPNIPGENGMNGALDESVKDAWKMVRGSDKLTEAFSDLARWRNKEGKMQSLDQKDPFVQKTLSKLDPTQRAAVLKVMDGNDSRHNILTKLHLPSVMNRLDQDATNGIILSMEPGMLPDQGREISSQLYNALGQLTDPAQSAVGAQVLQALAPKLQPNTFFAALQHAQSRGQNTAEAVQFFQKNPGYVSEQRYGTDKLVMTGPQGQKWTSSGTQQELAGRQQEMAVKGYSLLSYLRAQDVQKQNYGMSEEWIQALQQLDDKNAAYLQQTFANQPEVLAKVMPAVQRAGDIRAQLGAAMVAPKVTRSFAEGREYINMLDNADQFYARTNNMFTNRLVRSGVGLDVMHPEIAGNPELSKFVNDHTENYLTPDSPTARKITSALFYAKIGFNFGEAMLEGTQGLTTGMSQLIAETGSVQDALGYWSKAVKDYTARNIDVVNGGGGRFSDPEMGRLYELAKQRGILPGTNYEDFMDHDRDTIGAVGVMKYGMKKFANAFRKYNDSIIIMSAFQLAKERGMDFDDAAAYAFDTKNKGLFMAGKAQRGVGLYGIKTRAVPQLMSALNTYSQGWWSQMAMHWKLGYGNPPAGLSPIQRLGARKAFAYSIVAQAALGGVLGLPAVGQGLALFSQATGLDAKGWLKGNLANLFDEDQDSQGTLTSLALRGFGSARLPFDPSNRASISIPFLPVDSYKGFDPSLLGGAAVQTASDVVKGLIGVMRGDKQALDQALPNVLRNPVRLWQDEADIRDSRGALQYQLSPSERFFYGLGLTPSRVQAARDTAEAQKRANDNAVKAQEAQIDDIAKTYREQGASAAQAKINAMHSANNEVNVQNVAKSVAQQVVAQSVPQDPMRQVNPAADLTGLPRTQAPQEVQRQNLQTQVLQGLGATPAYSPRKDYQAAMLDAWMGSDSNLTLPQAQTYLGGKRPSARQNMPLLQQAFQ